MKFLRMLGWAWVIVLVLTGLGGGLIIDHVGWALADVLAMYSGNLDPVQPDLPFPWWLYALCVVAAAGGVAWVFYDKRAQRPDAPPPPWWRATAPLAVAYAGGLCAVLLPFYQLYRLYSAVQAAAGGPVMP